MRELVQGFVRQLERQQHAPGTHPSYYPPSAKA